MPPPRPGTGSGQPGAGLEADESGDERAVGWRTSARELVLPAPPVRFNDLDLEFNRGSRVAC